MINYVLWSGGFDSTSLLLDLVEINNSGIYMNNEIVAITLVNDIYCDAKNKREQRSRDKIKKYIKEKFPCAKVTYTEIKSSYDNIPDNIFKNRGICQPIAWLSAAMVLMESGTLSFGYIRDDDALQYKSTIVDLFNNLAKLQSDKEFRVRFPLENKYKWNILKDLSVKHPKVLQMCTSCENTKEEDKCGKCTPCLHIKRALYELHLNDEVQLSYKLWKKWFPKEDYPFKLENFDKTIIVKQKIANISNQKEWDTDK